MGIIMDRTYKFSYGLEEMRSDDDYRFRSIYSV